VILTSLWHLKCLRTRLRSRDQGREFGNFRRKISGNLLITYVNQLFPSPALQSERCKISTFLTNNSPDVYALTLCIMFRINNLFLAWIQQYQRIRLTIIDVITSSLFLIFPEISGKFPETLHFRKIYNPSRDAVVVVPS